MEVTINGEKVKLEENVTIKKLLSLRNVSMPDMVSVEYNGEILDKSDYINISVKDGDSIEFLYFMGGGSFGV